MSSCVLLCYLSETTVGIIIGSVFTLLGVFANGIVTHFLDREAHSREVEETKRCERKNEDDDIKKKREQVYLKFINYFSFLISLGSIRSASKADDAQWSDFVANVYKDDLKAMFRSISTIMTDIALYGTNEMSIKCRKFIEEWNGMFVSSEMNTIEEYKKVEVSLAVLLEERKKELGMG